MTFKTEYYDNPFYSYKGVYGWFYYNDHKIVGPFATKHEAVIDMSNNGIVYIE